MELCGTHLTTCGEACKEELICHQLQVTHIFEADFKQDFIKADGRKVIKSVKCVSFYSSPAIGREMCHGEMAVWACHDNKNRRVIYLCSR